MASRLIEPEFRKEHYWLGKAVNAALEGDDKLYRLAVLGFQHNSSSLRAIPDSDPLRFTFEYIFSQVGFSLDQRLGEENESIRDKARLEAKRAYDELKIIPNSVEDKMDRISRAIFRNFKAV